MGGISIKDKINTNFDYNEEIKKCKTIDDVMGKNWLIQKLVKDVLKNTLEAEMEDHLGRNKYERTKNEQGFNQKIRKFTKLRVILYTEESLNKAVYLASMEIIKNILN